jgi:hypothetical protein
MTRNGKIARLARAIRDQLNQRLGDGQEAKELAVWLNSLPEVQGALADHFDGQPINEVNLSQWKQGGFLEWQRLEQRREWLARLLEDCAGLQSAAADLPDKLGLVLATDFAAAARALLEWVTEPGERWQRLRQLLPELSRLRRDGHRFQAVQLAHRRADCIEAEAQARQAKAESRARVLEAARQHALAQPRACADPSLQALAAELSKCMGAVDAGLQHTNGAQGPCSPHCPPEAELKPIKPN